MKNALFILAIGDFRDAVSVRIFNHHIVALVEHRCKKRFKILFLFRILFDFIIDKFVDGAKAVNIIKFHLYTSSRKVY